MGVNACGGRRIELGLLSVEEVSGVLVGTGGVVRHELLSFFRPPVRIDVVVFLKAERVN